MADSNPLGQATQYPDQYDPSVLYAIARSESRSTLAIDPANLPFTGVDIWNAYELSWLDNTGKPIVAVGQFIFPAESIHMVESKSLKLYLNSFNQTRFESIDQVHKVLSKDLSQVAGCPVEVALQQPSQWSPALASLDPSQCLDNLNYDGGATGPNTQLLTQKSDDVITETLYSHLMRSLCPVTGQPDWATLFIEYRGKPIDREGLLAYIISFRQHQDFHEHCVEQIFTDLMAVLDLEELTVTANYLRRGGLDINPLRSTSSERLSSPRLYRQ